MDINYKNFKILKRGESGWVYIYILKDPITYEIRYVGKTIDPNKRLKEHVRKSTLAKTYKNNWIQQLIKKGLQPTLEIIDLVSEQNWGEQEQKWINKFRNEGVKLTNIADGGVGGNLGPIVNKKISEALTGKKLRPETKEKIRQSRIGHRAAEETRIKMSNQRKGKDNHMFGKNHSNETKEKIGKKSKINNSSTNNPMFGKTHSEKTKKTISDKLSILNSGINNPFFGKKHSNETKEKLKKKVLQLDINGDLIKIWDSVSEAATHINGSQSGISGVCDKENKTYKTFKWVTLK
jgi:group I intron endonuclease